MDYVLDLFKKMHGLKQVGRSVQEYTEEFYRLLIRAGHAVLKIFRSNNVTERGGVNQ